MDKLRSYLDSLKLWNPEGNFGVMYSNIIVRSKPESSFMSSVLKSSIAFAALFVVLSAGLYFSNIKGASDSPLSYVFEQESISGNGPINYIFGE